MTVGTQPATVPPGGTAPTDDSPTRPVPPRQRSTSLGGLIFRIVLLSVVLASTVYLVPLLIAYEMWMWLVVALLAVALIFGIYLTKRFIPAKYLFPGTFLLSMFLIVPILMTAGYSLTNFGDGTRGSKESAIAAIVGSSVQQAPDSPRYNLTIASQGAADSGVYTFFLTEQDGSDGTVYTGSADQELAPYDGQATVDANGRVTEVPGYTLLTPTEINDNFQAIQETTVQVDEDTAIKVQGVNQAFQGTATREYDEQQDAIVDTATGEAFPVGKVGDTEYFVDANGAPAFSQSWLQPVGLSNYEALFTNADVLSQFGGAFVWTLVFATVSVLSTFVLGYVLAVTLNDDRIRGKRLYRSLLLVPYAIPGFISLLIWRNFYNRDFGLINEMLNVNLNWLGDPTLAKVAVLLANLWMGFPYMFIVCTGALQSIPDDVKEAARIDGASGLQTTLRITGPLLLVSVAPLLVASFAFNFNNFNAIELLTGGGPFAPGEYTRGSTDILISMVYRIAFGGSGADFGFASTVAVMLFVLTGIIAAIQFRFTRALEDVN